MSDVATQISDVVSFPSFMMSDAKIIKSFLNFYLLGFVQATLLLNPGVQSLLEIYSRRGAVVMRVKDISTIVLVNI